MSDAPSPSTAAASEAAANAQRGAGSGHKGDRPRNVTIQATPTSVMEAPPPPRPSRTYRYPSGDVYTGEWRDNRKHGYGVAQYSSGHRYEGEWKNDKKDGHGTFTYDQGTSYTGSWKEDMKHGCGVALFASGTRYEGEWMNDNMHGQGSFIYGSCDTYTGEWVQGKMSGIGTWTSGHHISRYEGEWLNGVRHGRGLLFSYGRALRVVYENGHVVQQQLVAIPVPLVDVPAPVHVVVDLQADNLCTSSTATTLTLQSGEVLSFDDIATAGKIHQTTLERLTKDLLAGYHCTLSAYSPTADFLTAVSSKVATGFLTLLLHGLHRQDGSSKNSTHQHEGTVSLCMAAVSPTGVCCDLLDPSRRDGLAIREPNGAPLFGFRTETVHSPMELQTLQARAAAVRCGPGCLRCMQIAVSRRLVPKGSGPGPPPADSDSVYTSEVRALFLDLPALSGQLLFSADLRLEPALPPNIAHLLAHVISGNSKTTVMATVPATMTAAEGDQLLRHTVRLKALCKKVTPNQLLPPSSATPHDPAVRSELAGLACPISIRPPSPCLAVRLPVQPLDALPQTPVSSSPLHGDTSATLCDTDTHQVTSPMGGCLVESLPPLQSSLLLSPHTTMDFMHLPEPEPSIESASAVLDEQPSTCVEETIARPVPDPLLERLRGCGFVARRVVEHTWPTITDPSLKDAPFDTCLGHPIIGGVGSAAAESSGADLPAGYVERLQRQVRALERLVLRQQLQHHAEVLDFCSDVDFLLSLLTPQQVSQVAARMHPRAALSAVPPPSSPAGVSLPASDVATPPPPTAAHGNGKGRVPQPTTSDSDDSSDDSDSSAPSATPPPVVNVPPFVQQLQEMGFPQPAIDALLLGGPPLSNTDAVFEWLTYYTAEHSTQPAPPPPPQPPPAPPMVPVEPLRPASQGTIQDMLEQLVRSFDNPELGPYPRGTNMPCSGPTIIPDLLLSIPTEPTSVATPGNADSGDEPAGTVTKDEGLPICGICFEPFRLRGFILCCDHLFCYACIQKWARSKKTCPLCSRTFTQVFRSPIQIGPLNETQERFLGSLQEMGYLESDLQALRDCGPNLEQHDLVIRWLAEYRQNAERKALREAAERAAAQPKSGPALLSFGRSSSSGDARSPKVMRKAFEAELERIFPMESGTQQYWNAINQMVEWLNAKAFPPKEALKALKVPLKAGPHQLAALGVLEVFVSKCNHNFALEVATKKWMDRLLKIAKDSRDRQVTAKVISLLMGWERRFSSDQRFHEFSTASSKVRHRL